uniref:hypothetical protein Ycf1 n=1 Tax=Amentotaxus yunnanensis TaxID=89479 RepID=UPI001EE0649E|nr:hypothetical protein Ycf1 [Amentotaxus yunnanensis]UIX22787.1 hypothetical protein Ycf1 [Amentotaxus yunnanensis]
MTMIVKNSFNIILTMISSWLKTFSPMVIFGFYYGFLTTLPMGPAQLYFLRSLLIQENNIDSNNRIIPTGKIILSGSFVGQVLIFSSIYLCPIYAALCKPHAMALMFTTIMFFIFIKILFSDLIVPSINDLFPWINNPGIEFFIGVILQLVNPALFSKSIYTRLVNLMLFRYSGSLLFLLSIVAGWLSGQLLFIKVTKVFCSRVECDSPLRFVARKRHIAITFQIIFFGYFVLMCYGRTPAHLITKWVDERALIRGPQEEEDDENTKQLDVNKKMEKKKEKKKKEKEKKEAALNTTNKDSDSTLSKILCKPWPTIFFDYRRFNQPLRYVGVGDLILRGPVKSEVAQYFFDVCLSDGRQRISFTALPSMSFLAKMVDLGSRSSFTNQDPLDIFDRWIVTKKERRNYLGKELEDRVKALSNGFPVGNMLEKRVRFSRTKSGECLPEIHDPLLSGPFRGVMNQFQSPWLLPPEDGDSVSTKGFEKNQKSKNDHSTKGFRCCSIVRSENKNKVVRAKNNKLQIIIKWWLDKIRIFLLEEQETRTFLDEVTFKEMSKTFDNIYPKDSLEYILKILAPADVDIETEIASCDKKIYTNYLLNIFLQTTGTKWELLLSVLPTKQALLYEQFFLMKSTEFPSSLISMDVKDIPKEICKEHLFFEDKNSQYKDITDKNIPDEDFYYQDFFVLYEKFITFRDNFIFNDHEPRIRDFSKIIVPTWPSLLLSGVYDSMNVKDSLEIRPKKARNMITIKPFEKIEEEREQKEREEQNRKGILNFDFLKRFKEKVEEEAEEAEEEGAEEEGAEEEGAEEDDDDPMSKDIHVFSYPHEGDFRRLLVKGALRFQRRKVSLLNCWTAKPQSSLFERLKEMTKTRRHKPKPKERTKISFSKIAKSYEKKQKIKETNRRARQQGFDWEVLHYVRAIILFSHSYLRKRFYLPSLIIAKNIGRALLFQVPEWEQDWENLSKEMHMKCNYDGYELTDPDIPTNWLKDYVKEGVQIKILYPFRLRPWYESNPQSYDTEDKTSFLTMYGTETELPFGNPTKVPSFWKPIGQWIWDSIVQRINSVIQWMKPIGQWIKPIIQWMKPIGQWMKSIGQWMKPISQWMKSIGQWMKPISQWMKPIGQWIALIRSRITKVEMNKSELRPDTGSTENLKMNDRIPVLIRTRRTPNVKFSIEVVQDPLDPFLTEIKPDVDLEDPYDWTTTMNDRIKQMNKEYLLNLEICKNLQTDFKKKMDQPSSDIGFRLKKELARIKIWLFIFRKKSVRFIRKLPYFMKVFFVRMKLNVIDLKLGVIHLIESNLHLLIQLRRNIAAIRRIFITNKNRILNPITKKNQDLKKISQAYVFHKIWQQIRAMKGSYAKDLLQSRTSSPLIKKDVKEFLDIQGILDSKEPQDLRVKDWKQWLKWCAGYRIAPQKRKKVIGNRLGWSQFASFLGDNQFASFLGRLQKRIKRHRYDLLAYSYLNYMKEDTNGPAVQYIPEPNHQAITNLKKTVKDSDYSKNRKDSDYSKNRKNSDYSTTKKNYYYKFQFWLFPDIRKKVKNVEKLDDLFPPDILLRCLKEISNFEELKIPEDFDIDAYVMESIKKREEEKQKKLAEEQRIKQEKEKKKKEREEKKEERMRKLEAATTPEEVKIMKKAFRKEDKEKIKKKREDLKEKKRKRLEKKLATRAKKRVDRRAERAQKEKDRRARKLKNIKRRDFLVRDFFNLYCKKISDEDETFRIDTKNKIFKLDAEKQAEGDKKGWDEVQFRLDLGSDNEEEQTEEEIKKQTEEKEEIKEEIKVNKLAYREMAKNSYKWRLKYKLKALPLAPWLSKCKNAARFLDEKKLGSKYYTLKATRPYLDNGELDLELVETMLYMKSCFKENEFIRIFGDLTRRSTPLLPGYFNDRFLIYKIASFLLNLKRKGIDVNLFDRSVRCGKIKTMEDENENISSSLIFEYILIPRRRREFRILNRLNLENNLGESTGFYNSKDIQNDEGLMEKDEHLIIDTRQKIRRFLWPRYRLEDLICMNRYWWNTNDGSRSVMLRVRMYPKIEHWEHVQKSFSQIQNSFVSIREILKDLLNHTKSFLGFTRTKRNKVKDTKMNSLCTITLTSPLPFCYINNLPFRKLDEFLRGFTSNLRKPRGLWKKKIQHFIYIRKRNMYIRIQNIVFLIILRLPKGLIMWLPKGPREKILEYRVVAKYIIALKPLFLPKKWWLYQYASLMNKPRTKDLARTKDLVVIRINNSDYRRGPPKWGDPPKSIKMWPLNDIKNYFWAKTKGIGYFIWGKVLWGEDNVLIKHYHDIYINSNNLKYSRVDRFIHFIDYYGAKISTLAAKVMITYLFLCQLFGSG